MASGGTFEGTVGVSREVFSLEGTAGFSARLAVLADRGPKIVAGALYRFAEAVMTESKLEVPVEHGTLKDSGHVELPVIDRGAVEVQLGYGGPAESYAIEQHENLEYQHAEGKKAKYLEDPLKRHSDELLEAIGLAMRAALQRG